MKDLTPQVRDILQELYRGATLICEWQTWPDDNPYPDWIGYLEGPLGEHGRKITDSATLAEILRMGYVKRKSKSPQRRSQQAEWFLADAGALALGHDVVGARKVEKRSI